MSQMNLIKIDLMNLVMNTGKLVHLVLACVGGCVAEDFL